MIDLYTRYFTKAVVVLQTNEAPSILMYLIMKSISFSQSIFGWYLPLLDITLQLRKRYKVNA